jgi:phospholipase D1/2
MAGKPFKVGRFAHTLRVRLMQEHLGVDVDNLLDDGSIASGVLTPEPDRRELHPDAGQEIARGVTRVTSTRAPTGELAELVEGGMHQIGLLH